MGTALTGWGRTVASVATTVLDNPAAALADAGNRGVIARGLGRSYGDAAQNGGGTVVRLPYADADLIDLDPVAGRITVGGGVSFDQLLRTIVPQGWFVPVTPGTRFVTVGGAIAADIHGKNHHLDGTFGAHVESIEMRLADGSSVTVSPTATPDTPEHDLWIATVGGMGLTGVIERATFRLLPIESSRCTIRTERIGDLETLIQRINATGTSRYSVAWIDLIATGRHLGRSVLTTGDHTTLDELVRLDRRAIRDPLAFKPGMLPDVPPGLPNLLCRPIVRAFNEFWYQKTPRDQVAAETITGFFYPLDRIGCWNRLYGRAGFIQYQFVVPNESVGALRASIELVSCSGHASFLAVLKRFGVAGDGLLSFPRPGWTLTLDLPARAPGIDRLFDRLDELVLDAGGRHYLAKDATTRPAVIAAGYPELDSWRAIRDRVDPNRRWQSDLGRRLGLVAPAWENSS